MERDEDRIPTEQFRRRFAVDLAEPRTSRNKDDEYKSKNTIMHRSSSKKIIAELQKIGEELKQMIENKVCAFRLIIFSLN